MWLLSSVYAQLRLLAAIFLTPGRVVFPYPYLLNPPGCCPQSRQLVAAREARRLLEDEVRALRATLAPAKGKRK